MNTMKWIKEFFSPSKDKRIDIGRRNVIGAAVVGLARRGADERQSPGQRKDV
jgi:hypothetical protein